MVRDGSAYRCQECGFAAPKPGTCPDCARQGNYVQLVEERPAPAKGRRAPTAPATSAPVRLTDVRVEAGERMPTGVGELDRVLGGGVVRGSLVLIGGDPGIGKSTLLLETSRALADLGAPVLYVSGEESAAQVKLRADRLGISPRGLYFLAETNLEAIEAHAAPLGPRVLVVDSIQTVYLPDLESAPGSVSQVRECGGRLMLLAKRTGMATFLVGHVTKEGALAGPRVLEHLVDTVLYFEGEHHHSYRVLRAVKNRFGSTNEIGVFEMTERGLAEVKNPSGFFLSERPKGAPGSVVVASLEGSRPLLLELQVLVSPASFGTPRRTVLGMDYNRVCLLLAVLEKRLGFPLQTQDVFVNVAGGARVAEPAADLGLVAAAASSYTDRPVKENLVVFGEVGLAGEVRAVTGLDLRLREAAALGFAGAVVPRNNLSADTPLPLDARGVASIDEAIQTLLGFSNPS
ncbi:MAG: DNA repair protein RadA [Candidatus Rokubacteria bacterium]|nr:DNA repair protein RadA [Candidatus Rokubacteria bacterium]